MIEKYKKRILFMAFLMLSCISLIIGVMADQTGPAVAEHPVTDGPTYVVAIDREYKPYEFIDPAGRSVGFTPDLLTEIAAASGVTFLFKPMTWPEAVQGLNNGSVDLINMIYSPDRALEYEFSDPHSTIRQALFRNRTTSEIDDLESLANHRVGIQKDDIAFEMIGDRTDFELYIVNSKEEGFLYLYAGKLDAFFAAEQAGIHFIRDYALSNIEPAVLGLFPRDFCFATRKGNTELVVFLNKNLKMLKDSSRYSEIADKWFIAHQRESSWVARNWKLVVVVTSALIAILLISLVLNAILRRMVSQKTKKLMESEQRFTVAVKGSRDGIWDWNNLSSEEYWWSPRIYEMLGYRPGEVTPRLSLWRELMHPDDREKVLQVLQDHLDKGTPYEAEFRMKKKSGDYMWMFARGESVRDESGKPVRMAGSVTDITDRKKSELELRKAVNEKETLLREVHHRTKNNLIVLYSLINLQQERLRGDESPRDILDEAKQRIHIIGKIHQMLYTSNDLSELNFADYIRSITADVRNIYDVGEKKISLSLSLDDASMSIERALPAALIVNELITNAYKHAFHKRTSGHITISFKKNTVGYELRVDDDGNGMPQEVMSQKRKSLGMELITMLTKQLNGKLSYAVDNGSRFSITF